MSRAELATTLFPKSSRARQSGALRQALHRLRSWLPDLAISATRARVRLEEKVEIHPDLEALDPTLLPRLAIGLHHPVFAQLRSLGETKPVASAHAVEDHFFEAIRLMAAEDREAARQMLCGAPSITGLLSTSQLSALISLTRPNRKLDTMAVEHQELNAWLSYRLGLISEAVGKQRQARKWAVERGDKLAESRTTAYLLFHLIEAGQMEEATNWLDELNRSDRSAENRLLILNARAALFWNAGELEQSLNLMRAAEPDARLSSKWEIAHYHANLAVLLSEMRRQDEARLALETAERSIVGRHDVHSIACGHLVRMVLAAADRDLPGLHQIRQAGLSHTEESTNEVARWYVNELYSELLIEFGEFEAAQRVWSAVEAARRSGGGQLTPRLTRRKAIIWNRA